MRNNVEELAVAALEMCATYSRVENALYDLNIEFSDSEPARKHMAVLMAVLDYIGLPESDSSADYSARINFIDVYATMAKNGVDMKYFLAATNDLYDYILHRGWSDLDDLSSTLESKGYLSGKG